MKELRDLRAPGEAEAQRRAWELAAAALPAPAERRRRRRGPLAAAAGVALLLAALSPPGNAIADWLGDAVKAVVDERPAPTRASGLGDLPGGGRVLVLADRTAWFAGQGDHRTLDARADSATWSPHGRFVAAARGSELFALDLQGRRRWTIPAAAPVEGVRWSPDGFRVAYTTRDELRVVAGDGTGDRRVATGDEGRASVFGSFAWRPGVAGHVLAFVKRDSLFLADLDARRVLWRVTARDHPALAFSPDGARLLLTGAGGMRVLRASDGRVLRRTRARRPGHLTDATWDRTGRRIALVRKTVAGDEVRLGTPRDLRTIFAARDLRLVGFSPDGRWLLVDWTESGSWLFLPVDGGRPRQLTGVARRFGARNVVPQAWSPPQN